MRLTMIMENRDYTCCKGKCCVIRQYSIGDHGDTLVINRDNKKFEVQEWPHSWGTMNQEIAVNEAVTKAKDWKHLQRILRDVFCSEDDVDDLVYNNPSPCPW
jgi:hypothetical protein